MFKEKTVIILGAGASCHYDYPSGEGLIDNLINNAKNIFDPYFNYANDYSKEKFYRPSMPSLNIKPSSATMPDIPTDYHDFNTLLKKLHDSLESFDPVMIDSFLNNNRSLRGIGTLMIAYEILKCENTEKLNRNNTEKNNWYKYLVDSIVSGCVESADILKNNLHIITFNYDVSLEHYLYTRLTSIQRFTQNDVIKFLDNPEKPLITHVYGKVRENPFENNEYGRIFKEKEEKEENVYKFKIYKHTIELAYEASKKLEVIDKEKTAKLGDSDQIINAREKLKEANKVFILGFGFYEDNMELIGLTRANLNKKRLIYTNYTDMQRIENKVKSSILMVNGDFIKSTKNVYDALIHDFDFT